MIKDRPWCSALLVFLGALTLFVFQAQADSAKARQELARLNLSFTPEDLIIAVKNSDLIAVKLFLDAGMKADVKALQVTPLGVAAGLGNKEAAQILIEGGANLEATFDLDETFTAVTPLHACCINGKFEVAKLLIGKGANPAAVDAQGAVPLHYAAMSSTFEEIGKPLATLLLSKGANVNQTNKLGGTPLSYAARANSPDAITFLLANGADAKHTNKLGWTAIDVARKAENAAALAAFLKHGVELITQDFKETAIQKFRDEVQEKVLTTENVESVNKLIQDRLAAMKKQFSFSTEEMTRAQNAAHQGVSTGALAVSKTMMSTRSDEDNQRLFELTKLMRTVKVLQEDQKKRKNLMDALQERDAIKIAKAIKEGADPNSVDDEGRSLLSQAVGADSLEMVKALVENGADVNVGMPNGSTPLHVAIAMKRYEIATFLLEKKADVNKPLFDGVTPLMTAAEAGDVHGVEILMAHGANKHAQDGKGVSAHDYAGKNVDVAKLLE
ncbi:MAG: uncharacterized protein JWM68_1887 [Verrucomicrobiales bacterium]|nr:uncharacterized protein [Verrucomicrobiales bacterium]